MYMLLKNRQSSQFEQIPLVLVLDTSSRSLIEAVLGFFLTQIAVGCQLLNFMQSLIAGDGEITKKLQFLITANTTFVSHNTLVAFLFLLCLCSDSMWPELYQQCISTGTTNLYSSRKVKTIAYVVLKCCTVWVCFYKSNRTDATYNSLCFLAYIFVNLILKKRSRDIFYVFIGQEQDLTAQTLNFELKQKKNDQM